MRDPHVAIMKAAKEGRGLRLSAEEVAYLATDSAIETRAEAVLSGDADGSPAPRPTRLQAFLDVSSCDGVRY